MRKPIVPLWRLFALATTVCQAVLAGHHGSKLLSSDSQGLSSNFGDAALLGDDVQSILTRNLAFAGQIDAHARRSLSTDETGIFSVAIVYGTRPELVKLAPVIRACRAKPWNVTVINTGQHKNMLDGLAEYLDAQATVTWQIMKHGQSVEKIFERVSQAVVALLDESKYHAVIVQGDTTTAAAVGHVAFHKNVHVIHVESGLRTGRLDAPFPEEYNRKVLGVVCSLCFAPTTVAATALASEGVSGARLFTVGNTVVDSYRYAVARPVKKYAEQIEAHIVQGEVDMLHAILTQPSRSSRQLVLVTAHRRESIAAGALANVVKAVANLAQAHTGTVFAVLLHKNPRARAPFTSSDKLKSSKNVLLLEPPTYSLFMQMLKRATLLLTDSGGLQEEGLSASVPVLVTRETTERIEGVRAGGAKLVGFKADRIITEVTQLLTDTASFQAMAGAHNPYGDGTTASQIVRIIESHLPMLKRPSREFLRSNTATLTEFSAARTRHPAGDLEKLAEPWRRRPGTLAVILTGYKRSVDIMRKQISALRKSTKPPDVIMLVQNEEHTDFSPILEENPDIIHVHFKRWNTKYIGRFAPALLLDTEFVAVVDDDTVPRSKFLALAVKTVKEQNAIVGTSGRILNPKGFDPATKSNTAWQQGNDQRIKKNAVHEVDFLGHWWVFRTEWSHVLFGLDFPTIQTGEDMEFCAKLQMMLGVRSMIPHANEPEELGDEADTNQSQQGSMASWRKPGIFPARKSIARWWVAHGWRPLKLRLGEATVDDFLHPTEDLG